MSWQLHTQRSSLLPQHTPVYQPAASSRAMTRSTVGMALVRKGMFARLNNTGARLSMQCTPGIEVHVLESRSIMAQRTPPFILKIITRPSKNGPGYLDIIPVPPKKYGTISLMKGTRRVSGGRIGVILWVKCKVSMLAGLDTPCPSMGKITAFDAIVLFH